MRGSRHTPPAGYLEAEDAENGWVNLSGAYKENVAAARDRHGRRHVCAGRRRLGLGGLGGADTDERRGAAPLDCGEPLSMTTAPALLDHTQKQPVRYAIDLWLRDEQIRVNTARVKARIAPHYELRNEPVAIACFGPSLNDTWERLRDFPHIISCSGSHRFLLERGLVPTWHVEVDPRAHKIQLLGDPHPDVEYLPGVDLPPVVHRAPARARRQRQAVARLRRPGRGDARAAGRRVGADRRLQRRAPRPDNRALPRVHGPARLRDGRL